MGSATRNSLNFAGEDNSNLLFESMNTESKVGVFLGVNDDCYKLFTWKKIWRSTLNLFTVKWKLSIVKFAGN